MVVNKDALTRTLITDISKSHIASLTNLGPISSRTFSVCGKGKVLDVHDMRRMHNICQYWYATTLLSPVLGTVCIFSTKKN